MKRTPRDAPWRADSPLIEAIGLLPDRVGRQRPLYRAVATALEDAIGRGVLEPGQRLPPERLLAGWLRMSRTTIVQAYRELESRGLVRGYVGRGTFVSAAPEPDGAPFAWRGKVAASVLGASETYISDLMREATNVNMLSIGAGAPALDVFPEATFMEALDRVLTRRGRAVWSNGPTEGQPEFRERIAERHGGRATRILALAGAQQGLDLLARCLIDPGDVVIVDRPGYLGALHSFREAGARIHGWDVTRGDLDELEDLLLRYRPKLIYTNPTFQNPTGWTMPLRMRRELLQVAGRYRVPVVEDDTYRELPFTTAPPPSLQSLDEQSIVIHLNSFSKALAPGLRLGWISAAEPIIEHLSLIKQRADPQTQNLVQFVVADMLESGAFDTHLTRLRAEHRRRSQAAAAAIQRAIRPDLMKIALMPAGGLYFWCRLAPSVNARALLERSIANRVSFVPGDAFYADRAGNHELRLCFATISADRADEFGRQLADSLRTVSTPRPVRAKLVAKA